jgi:nucleotide-binding universal stress UspA family protein
MPITVLRVEEGKKRAPKKDEGKEEPQSPLKEAATEGAKKGHRAAQEEKDEEKPEKVEVSERKEGKLDDAVAREGGKGYDLLLIGLKKMHTSDGSFTTEVDKAATGFDGPLALACVGDNENILNEEGFNILVPVNGTESSRRGAELAFAISSARKGKITALHIADRRAGNETRQAKRANAPGKRVERAVLEDTTELAKRYGHDSIATAVHTDTAPEAAVLEEARRIHADLIVVGANRRVGEELYLGQTVNNILQKWKGAIILVVT